MRSIAIYLFINTIFRKDISPNDVVKLYHRHPFELEEIFQYIETDVHDVLVGNMAKHLYENNYAVRISICCSHIYILIYISCLVSKL